MKFSIKDFFRKYDQICRSSALIKPKFLFVTVFYLIGYLAKGIGGRQFSS